MFKKSEVIKDCAILGLLSGIAGITPLISIPAITIYAGYKLKQINKANQNLIRALSYWTQYQKK